MDKVMDALNYQIEQFEKNPHHIADPLDANRIIRELGGVFEVGMYSSAQSVCVYITVLAVRRMFELNNGS